MKVWELRACLNSLPISMDDVEVFYSGGIDHLDKIIIFKSVDFLEPCDIEGEKDGLLLHNGYLDEDEECQKLALLN
jgi:hypothetical protein